MLVLARKSGDSVIINGNIIVQVLDIRGNRVRLGVTAPQAVKVLRDECVRKDRQKNGQGTNVVTAANPVTTAAAAAARAARLR